MPTRFVPAMPAVGLVSPVNPDAARPKRMGRRTPYRVPCRVRLVDVSTGVSRTVVGETVNISTAGLALQVGVDAPVGTWVETLVAHPKGDPIFLCGTVVHSRRMLASNYEIGVTIMSDAPPGVA